MGNTGYVSKKKNQLSGTEKIGVVIIAAILLIAMLLFEAGPVVVQQPELTREELVFVPFITEGAIIIESDKDLLSVGLDASNLPEGLVFAGWEIDGHMNHAKNSGFTMHKDLARDVQVRAIATKGGMEVSQKLNLVMTG